MIYCFSNDFDTILIRCYYFGPSRANGSKTSLFLHIIYVYYMYVYVYVYVYIYI